GASGGRTAPPPSGSSPSARARGERGCTSTVRCSSRDRRLCSAASRGRRPPDIAQALRPTLTTVRGSAIPIFVAPAEAGVQASARYGAPLFVYRGRGAVSLLPALRTVRAVLPHTALRSVVIYIEIGVQERELARG